MVEVMLLLATQQETLTYTEGLHPAWTVDDGYFKTKNKNSSDNTLHPPPSPRDIS